MDPGSYPAGQFTYMKINNKVFCHFLEPGKRAEANNGFIGAANKIKCPDNLCNPVKNKGMQSCIGSCHETINWQFKIWDGWGC